MNSQVRKPDLVTNKKTDIATLNSIQRNSDMRPTNDSVRPDITSEKPDIDSVRPENSVEKSETKINKQKAKKEKKIIPKSSISTEEKRKLIDQEKSKGYLNKSIIAKINENADKYLQETDQVALMEEYKLMLSEKDKEQKALYFDVQNENETISINNFEITTRDNKLYDENNEEILDGDVVVIDGITYKVFKGSVLLVKVENTDITDEDSVYVVEETNIPNDSQPSNDSTIMLLSFGAILIFLFFFLSRK